MLDPILFADLIRKIEHLYAEKKEILLIAQRFKDRVLCTYEVGLLSQLKAAVESNHPTQELERVLEENWKHVKGTLVSYTARPQDNITILLCEIAQCVSAKTKKSALTVLMPDLLTEMMPDDIKEKLKTTLRTHILSECGKYLLPIDILCKLTLPEDSTQPWFNPYYDSDDIEENFSIKPIEKTRLFHHSSETEALLNAKKEYARFLNKESLLGHLNELIQKLRFNGAHQGIGSQANAGEGAYSAIIRFHDYYSLLSDQQKARIPLNLKNEIEKLIELSTNPAKNINATENMETCIGTREEKMRPEIIAHQVLLNEIGIDVDKNTELLCKAKDMFEKQSIILKEKLEKNQYQGGSDKLPITRKLLEYLKVQLSISTPEELNDFLRCYPKEIHEILLNNKDLKAQIIQQLGTLELFVTLILQTSAVRLNVLLHHIGNSYVEKHIHDIDDVSACLMLLDEERFNIVSNILERKIKRADDFNMLLKKSSLEKRVMLYKKFKATLPKMINNALDFSNLLFNLNPEQRLDAYETLKDKLPEMINSSSDFMKVISEIPREQRTEVYLAFKDKLPDMINNPITFKEVLFHLKKNQCKDICQAIKNKLPEIIKTPDDFFSLFMWMNSKKCAIVFTSIKDEVIELIGTADDFVSLLQGIAYEHGQNLRQEIYEKTKDKLFKTIKNAKCFLSVVRYIPPAQSRELYELTKQFLLTTIKNANDFRDILAPLTSEQRTEIYKTLKDKLPKFIKAAKNLHSVLIFLTPEQRSEVYEKLNKVKLSSFIKNSRGFFEILELLTPAQRVAVYTSAKDDLTKIIKSATDLENVLYYLAPTECMEILKLSEKNIPKMIKSLNDFLKIALTLEHEGYAQIYNLLKGELPKFVKTAYNFQKLLEKFSSDKRTMFYEFFKEKLPEMIKNANNFEEVFLYLTSAQRVELYEKIRPNLPNIIKKEDEFNSLCHKFDFIKGITKNYASIKQKNGNNADPLMHDKPLLFTDLHPRNRGKTTNACSSEKRAIPRPL